jgi:hypothetical protein
LSSPLRACSVVPATRRNELSLLDENLALGLAAVKYAKEKVRRSANQHYFKSKSPFKQNKRNDFLLGATRTTNYIEKYVEKEEDGETKRYFDKIKKDPLLAQRRKEIELIVASTMTKREKNKKIDELMKKWGKDYFWEGGSDGKVHWSDKKDGWKGKDSFGNHRALLSSYSNEKKLDHLKKYTTRSEDNIIDSWNNEDERGLLLNEYLTFISAANAKRFGVGNCQEKAEVACEYIFKHGPGGRRLALFCLEEEHKGLTGIITGAGGDHVFGIYGFDTVATSIDGLGPNAVVLDGWMNDAYPARHHLKAKYGTNYDNKRINLKQFTCRNMVCVSYRNHIELQRDLGTPPKGPLAP